MRRKPVGKEKIAIIAFIAAVLVAAGIFYYIWQGQYGMSPAGTRGLACIRAGLSAQECAATQLTTTDASDWCAYKKKTEQNDGCTTENSGCILISTIMGNEDVRTDLIARCPTLDSECFCREYVNNYEAQTDITTTEFLAVGRRCPYIHKRTCPR